MGDPGALWIYHSVESQVEYKDHQWFQNGRDKFNYQIVIFDLHTIFCHQQFKIEAIYLTVYFPDDYPLHVSIFIALLQNVKVPAGKGSWGFDRPLVTAIMFAVWLLQCLELWETAPLLSQH